MLTGVDWCAEKNVGGSINLFRLFYFPFVQIFQTFIMEYIVQMYMHYCLTYLYENVRA